MGRLFLPFLLVIFASSCIVSKKKFDDLQTGKWEVDRENESLKKELASIRQENERLSLLQKKLLDDALQTEKRLTEQKQKIERLENERSSLSQSVENLSLSSGKLSSDIERQRADLLKAEQNFQLAKVENEKLLYDLKEREERVKALEKIIADKEKAVSDLKSKISQALLNFKENDLTVNVRNGKVYVSLAEQLLFKSGSVAVDPKGIQALKQLSEALRTIQDVNVLIEGHTDDVPVSKTSQYMNDNWDLGVMRATAITRILTANGVNPEKITAASRGEFFPLEKAKTAATRQKNRRTEIILSPKLDELFQLLETN